MPRPTVLLALCAALAGCAVYPTARDLKRVQEHGSGQRLTAATIPGGDAYLRLVGQVVEVEGAITAVDDSGPVRLTIDNRVLCAFAKDNQDEARTRHPGERVVVRGILRYDPDRAGWLSPALLLPLGAPATAATAASQR
jgi:hypothetical protein